MKSNQISVQQRTSLIIQQGNSSKGGGAYSESNWRGQANPLNRTVTIWPISASADCIPPPPPPSTTQIHTHTSPLLAACQELSLPLQYQFCCIYIQSCVRPVHRVKGLQEEEGRQILESKQFNNFGQKRKMI